MRNNYYLLRTFILFILCLFPLRGTAQLTTTQPPGAGTETSPYQVGTREELLWIATEAAADVHVLLTADIDLNPGFVFNDDGTYTSDTGEEPFQWPRFDLYWRGVFDGNGHTISGLYFNDPTALTCGFIDVNREGVIKNLKLIDGYMGVAAGGAGLCGISESGSQIINCYCNLSVQALDKEAADFYEGGVGGICFYNSGFIQYSVFAGAIHGLAEGNAGICAGNDGEVKSCINLGKIIGEDGSLSYGVCSDNAGTVTNCYYLEGTASKDASGATMKTAEELANGTLVTLLNEDESEPVWGQRIGEDPYPVQLVFVSEKEQESYQVYSVTLNIEGKTELYSYNSDTELPVPEKEGYVFDGWYTAETGGEKITSFPTDGTTATYYARWQQIYTVTVTQPTEGGTIESDKETAIEGETVTLNAYPAEDYELEAWSVTETESGATVELTDNTFTMPAANVTVTATFVAVYNITVTPPTGGTISVSAETAHEGDEITLTATPAEGYKFVSWNVTTDNGTVDVTDSEGIYTVTMPAANVTVTATFTAIDYNITVTQPTGGTISVSAETAHVGDLITLTATPNANYEFTSWSVTYQSEEGTTVAVEVTNNTFTMPAADVTVSAVFTYVPPTYTITVTQPSTGGSISADKKEATEGETVTLSYTEHSNYDFAGWTVTRDDDGSVISTSSNTFRMPASDVTVTAQFRYDPPYIPSYYDIYFDGNENDSVRYDCSDTNVREGGTFSFTVEVAAGYAPETLVVEYKRGRGGSWREVTPNSSGRYRITNVHADIYVRSCIEPIEDPTAIEQVGDGKSTVRCDGKRIRITTPEPQTMHIINVGGRLVRTAQLPAGDTEVNDLPQGFYIVVLSDGTRTKALIN